MNKIVLNSIAGLCFLSLFASAKIEEKEVIILNNPIMGLIDGLGLGINANVFGLILQSRREGRKRLYGIYQADGTRVGLYEFEGQKYCLEKLADIEKEIEAGNDNARKDALKELLIVARNDFISAVDSYIDSARGMKAPLLIIIEEFYEKSGLGEFFLLDWASTDDGGEIESMSENVNSFKDLKILSLEMIGFLEALARSCPKGKALFVDMVKRAKKNKA